MKLLSIIRKYRRRKVERKSLENFLKYGTNIDLKDCINKLPRPSKSILRILCTSDSMREQLKTLKGDADYMVVNSYIQDPSYMSLKPKYYVIADPNFYKICNDDINKIFKETIWDMVLFVPWSHTCKYDWLKSSDHISLVRVNGDSYYVNNSIEHRNWCYDHNLAMPPVYNVLNMAIYIAIYLGYKNVELYGVEHSWTKYLTVGEDNKLYRYDSHFYDSESVQKTVYVRAIDGSNHKLHEILEEYANVFKTYFELRELAERHGCQILNCTPGSFIDAFERKKQ